MPLRMPKCTISYGDDYQGVIGDVKGGVTSIGTSPAASVRILQWDPEQRRMVSFDRLTDATITTNKTTGVTEVTGQSEKLVLEMHMEDPTITLRLTPDAGCRDCR